MRRSSLILVGLPFGDRLRTNRCKEELKYHRENGLGNFINGSSLTILARVMRLNMCLEVNVE